MRKPKHIMASLCRALKNSFDPKDPYSHLMEDRNLTEEGKRLHPH